MVYSGQYRARIIVHSKTIAMKNWTFFTALAFMLLTACQQDNGVLDLSMPNDDIATQNFSETLSLYASVKQVYLGQPVTLKINESALVFPDRITITLKEVSEDSRCPTGYHCVWEGRAVLAFSFEKYDEYLTARLATPNYLPDPPNDLNVYNRNVKLLNVAPYPLGARPVPVNAYRATIVVDRTDGGEAF